MGGGGWRKERRESVRGSTHPYPPIATLYGEEWGLRGEGGGAEGGAEGEGGKGSRGGRGGEGKGEGEGNNGRGEALK